MPKVDYIWQYNKLYLILSVQFVEVKINKVCIYKDFVCTALYFIYEEQVYLYKVIMCRRYENR